MEAIHYSPLSTSGRTRRAESKTADYSLDEAQCGNREVRSIDPDLALEQVFVLAQRNSLHNVAGTADSFAGPDASNR
jgi:hypothetical protein